MTMGNRFLRHPARCRHALTSKHERARADSRPLSISSPMPFKTFVAVGTQRSGNCRTDTTLHGSARALLSVLVLVARPGVVIGRC